LIVKKYKKSGNLKIPYGCRGLWLPDPWVGKNCYILLQKITIIQQKIPGLGCLPINSERCVRFPGGKLAGISGRQAVCGDILSRQLQKML
jgi:hypothetical protein